MLSARAYYHRYLENFISFLVPPGKRVFEIPATSEDPVAIIRLGEGTFDYIVLSDVLGYVYDVQELLTSLRPLCIPSSRIVITQYSHLWEPFLRLASFLHLRRLSREQNWLSRHDIANFLTLSGYEVVKSGGKMLFPLDIPFVAPLLNKVVANLPLINRLCLINYIVARPRPVGMPGGQLHSLSIIVAARNEAGTIERIINELPTLGSFTELIFIEGNSTDDTRAVIERCVNAYRGNKRLSWAVQEGKGKGDAVRKGFALAQGDILMIYDADMTVPPNEIARFYEAISLGTGEFINGSRLVYPMEKESMRLLNYIANKFFGTTFSWILDVRIKDTLCGTKVLSREDYADIERGRAFFGDFDPFGDFDLLFGAAKLNRKIIDLPVHYKERTYGSTNISRFRHGWLLLKMVFFSLRKIKFI